MTPFRVFTTGLSRNQEQKESTDTSSKAVKWSFHKQSLFRGTPSSKMNHPATITAGIPHSSASFNSCEDVSNRESATTLADHPAKDELSVTDELEDERVRCSSPFSFADSLDQTTHGNLPVRVATRKSDTSCEEAGERPLFVQAVKSLTATHADYNPKLAYARFEQILNEEGFSRKNWFLFAQCLNNMSVAARILSHVDEALQLALLAKSITVHAIATEKLEMISRDCNLGSDWMDLGIDALDLSAEVEWTCAAREMSVTDVDLAEQDMDSESVKVLLGPPIVTLLMDILTNVGNALYTLGKTEDALETFAKCLRLAEHCLECVPVPAEFRFTFPLSIAHRFSTRMNGNAKPRSESPSFPPDPNMPTPAPFRRIHLSYLHRSLLIAQARSLTHVGICCHALGLDNEAILCNSHALEMTQFYRKFGVFGYLEKVSNSALDAKNSSVGSSSSHLHKTENVWDYCSIVVPETGPSKPASKKSIRNMLLKGTGAFVKEVVDPLRASVLANIAASYYAKGRIPASMDSLIHSSSVFKEVSHHLGYTRAISSINALKVEIGRRLKELQWSCGVQDNVTVPEHFNWFWDGMAAPKSTARKWILPALKGLKASLVEFQKSNDVVGMLITMLNIASAYNLLGSKTYAFVALKVLGSLMTQETESGLKVTQEFMTPTMRTSIQYVLCQAVFLLRTMHPEEVTDLIEVWPDEFFYWDDIKDGILRLSQCLETGMVNVMNLEAHAMFLKSSLQTMQKSGTDTVDSWAYFQLLPYISESLDSSSAGSSRLLPDTAVQSSNVLLNESYAYGINTGISFIHQQTLLVDLLLVKDYWLAGRSKPPYDALHDRKTALQLYETLVKTVLELLPGPTIPGEYIPALQTCAQISARAESMLSNPHGSQRSFSTNTPHQNTPALELIPEIRAMLQTSQFIVPSLYTTCTDLMAATAVQYTLLRQNLNAPHLAASLSQSLKANAIQGDIHDAIRQILAAGADSHSHSLGMCIECMQALFEDADPALAVKNMWFVSLEGNVLEAEVAGASMVGVRDADSYGISVRQAMVSGGRHLFPCLHFGAKFQHPLGNSDVDSDGGHSSDDDNDTRKPGLAKKSAKATSDSRFAAAMDPKWASAFGDAKDEEDADQQEEGDNQPEDADEDEPEFINMDDALPPDQQPDILNADQPSSKEAVKKPITLESLKSFTETVNNTGLVYISRLPPFMTPAKLRQLLQQHGQLGRLYAAPEDAKTAYRRKKYRGNKRVNYTEAWVEFEDKKVARKTAEFLNLRNMGGKKRDRFYDDLWNIKYLPRFKWHHLTDQISYERAVRDQKVRTEMEQVKRETKAYMQNVDRAKMIEAMEAKKKRKREEEGLAEKPSTTVAADSAKDVQQQAGRKFRQREVKQKDTVAGNKPAQGKSSSKAKVLSKIFG
ncbi:Activator of basal transcription 1 [Chytriomyces hyalinus]|nr:Activator of basal transcription 1 [Chytriomyces hyalinus]